MSSELQNEMSNKTENSRARVLVSISSGLRKGKTLLFTGHNVCVFGRASNSFEILDKMDQTIGRHHFSLEIDPPEVRLRDLQSLNGTYVNGQKIGGSDGEGAHPESYQSTRKDGHARQGGSVRRESSPIILRHGDKIQAGSDIFDIAVEMPVPCGRCGIATDLYATTIEQQSTSRAFCSVCCKALSFEIAAPEIAAPESAPDPALNVLAVEKEALTKYLEEASHDERRATAYSIMDFEFNKLLDKRRYGAVWLAREKKGARDVMVRIVPANGIADTRFQADMNARLEAIRNLRHQNIVKIFAYGYAANVLYVASEYCDAGNISQHMYARKNGMETHEAIRIIIQALQGLAFIHQNGLTHGDLQPYNLLLHTGRMELECRLSDAGLLYSLWNAGLKTPYAVGNGNTSAFIAPEFRDHGKGGASPPGDVWSIAAVFYYMLSGKLPLEPKNDPGTAGSLKRLDNTPIARHRPDIMPEMAQLIDDSLRLEPALRPKDAVQMLERMKDIQSKFIHLTIVL